jgi:site-specific DNA-adenine methylase
MFKWFGSKWMASRHYPRPRGESIIEPFAGSAGYSLRHSGKKVTVAESDHNLSRLWQWLIQSQEEEILSIPINNKEGADILLMPLSDGQKLLLKNWQRTNNVSECWTISPWGNKPGQWTENCRKRVANDIKYIKHWKVYDGDGFSLLESELANDPLATWLIDPPYLYNYRYKNGSCFDYERLASAVKALKGQVIACEAICPKTGRTPSYLPFSFFAETVTSRRAEGCNTHSKELIYHRLPLL